MEPTNTPCSATSPRFRRQDRSFIDRRDVKRTLTAAHHQRRAVLPRGVPVGAYQEILGDLHNLVGDTDAVQSAWTSVAAWC